MNIYILLGLQPVSFSIERIRLRWLGHVEHKDDADWVKWCMSMETKGTGQRGRPRKTWWVCAKVDMGSFGLSREDAQDRENGDGESGGIG